MSDELEARLRRIEAALEVFFGALAATDESSSVGTTDEAGRCNAVVVPRRAGGSHAALRDAVAHEGPETDGAASLRAEMPAESEAEAGLDPGMWRQAEETNRLIKALIPTDSDIAILAAVLLIERDGAALRQRGAEFGCWDVQDGRLIGEGKTKGAASADAVRRGHNVSWIVIKVPDLRDARKVERRAGR